VQAVSPHITARRVMSSMDHDEVLKLAADLPASRRLLYFEQSGRTPVRYVFVNKVCVGERSALRHIRSVLFAGRRFEGLPDTAGGAAS
jgi:hypothetical protein